MSPFGKISIQHSNNTTLFSICIYYTLFTLYAPKIELKVFQGLRKQQLFRSHHKYISERLDSLFGIYDYVVRT